MKAGESRSRARSRRSRSSGRHEYDFKGLDRSRSRRRRRVVSTDPPGLARTLRPRAHHKPSREPDGLINDLRTAWEKLKQDDMAQFIAAVIVVLGLTWVFFPILGPVLFNAGKRVFDAAASVSFTILTVTESASAHAIEMLVTSYRSLGDPSGFRGSPQGTMDATFDESVLCASFMSRWLAPWLHVPCVPPNRALLILSETLNETLHVLDHWEIIAAASLTDEQSVSSSKSALHQSGFGIEFNDAQLDDAEVAEKQMLIERWHKLREGLSATASCFYSIELDINLMQTLMMFEAQEIVREVGRRSSHQWFTGSKDEYRRIEHVLFHFINYLDEQTVKLIAELNTCISRLEETTKVGHAYKQLLPGFQQVMDHQHGERQKQWFGRFDTSFNSLEQYFTRLRTWPWPPLEALSTNWSNVIVPLEAHRQKLLTVKSSISYSYGLSTATGLDQLMKILPEFVSHLENAQERHWSSSMERHEERRAESERQLMGR